MCVGGVDDGGCVFMHLVHVFVCLLLLSVVVEKTTTKQKQKKRVDAHTRITLPLFEM